VRIRTSSRSRWRRWRLPRLHRRAGASLLVLAVGCRGLLVTTPPRWSPDLPEPALSADSTAIDTIASGVLHRSYLVRSGPWMVHVLDVDLSQCWSPVALKGFGAATGRKRTSELVSEFASSGRSAVAGGVNGDFFLFAPPGIPVGALVRDGRLMTGPVARPVFAIDSAGRPWLGAFSVVGRAVSGVEQIRITAWNRHVPDGLALFDAAYGAHVDSVRGTLRVALSSPRGGRVVQIDANGGPTAIPPDGAVLVAGARAGADVLDRMLMLARTRGRFDVEVRLAPYHPREAVGGFPILARGGAEVAGLDSAGAPTFAPARHPRTIVGIGANGRRLLLVTVDGRQPGYSAGMTLREAARLALDLGATDAINLDGGGSTTMVVARAAGGGPRFEVVNRPSDPQGERAVGNALAVAGCTR
jgi:hypothetical protein